MMMVVSWLLSMQSPHPEHPGRIGDYIEAWDFDMDIRADESERKFTVDIVVGHDIKGTA
jgi:hypothetical protein